MKTILVTGATGFIGSKLVRELVRRGHVVHALTRRTSDRSGLCHDQIKLVTGDIQDLDSLKQAMQGCSQVYHVAAYAKNWAPDNSVFFRQNVDGLRNVIEAAKQCGIERIVYTATVVTLGPTALGTVGSEDTPRLSEFCYTEYERSKVVAEQLALAYAAEGFPIVIVNPTRVYGPGKLTEGNSVSQMIDLYDRGRVPILLNGGVNIGNYVFVDDLVKGHIQAMEKGRAGQRYILGGENVSLKHFFELVNEVSGKKHRQINLSPSLALLYAKAEQKKAQWFGIYPRITPGWVETFLHDWAYSSAKAEKELEYTITPLKEGIRMTYEWLLGQRSRSKGLREETMEWIFQKEQMEYAGSKHKRTFPRISAREACEESNWSNFWPVWSRH